MSAKMKANQRGWHNDVQRMNLGELGELREFWDWGEEVRPLTAVTWGYWFSEPALDRSGEDEFLKLFGLPRMQQSGPRWSRGARIAYCAEAKDIEYIKAKLPEAVAGELRPFEKADILSRVYVW